MAEEMPPGFPRNTIQVIASNQPRVFQLTLHQTQRALTAVALLYPQRLAETIATIYDMSFAKRQDVHTSENLLPVFTKLFGDAGAKDVMANVST